MNDHFFSASPRTPRIRCVLFALALLLCCGTAHAAVQAAQLFADHMVLQRDIAVPVWGWAEAGEPITVTIDGQEQKAVTGADGRWQVRLAPLTIGAPRTMTIAGRQETLRFTDILVGEVWVCGGQSNMSFPVVQAKDGAHEIETADMPEIRLFEATGGKSPTVVLERMNPKHLPDGMNGSGQERCVWHLCDRKSVVSFSAAGYFFGRALQRELKVPIGLIHNGVGATPIEAWMSNEALAAAPELKKVLDWWTAVDAFAETTEGKRQVQALVDAADKKIGKWGWRQDGYQPPLNRLGHPSTFFNSRVNPLIPYAIRGVIWYQGEANTGNAYEYRSFFPALIADWRKHWGQGDFPFLFVQLANWGGPPKAAPTQSEWAELREAQAMALKLPHTGMAVTIDIGNPGDIHPNNKQDVGARLALVARAVAYGEKLTSTGPVYREAKSEGHGIRVFFDSIGGGLAARSGAVKGFAIAGDDRVFVWATAEIQGDSILLSADQVKTPVAARYAWAHCPDCNLINQEGLPASPFRTDAWPGLTDTRGFQAKNTAAISFEVPK